MSRLVIPDHLAHRPVVSGMVVPYVTIWTNESKIVGEVARGRDGLVGRHLERRWGMTLIATPNAPGGKPEWKATHSFRQRRCMISHRCQVCGNKIDGPGVFLIPWGQAGEVVQQWDDFGTTKQPPVCEACLDGCMSWCPHLRHIPPTHTLRGYGRVEGVTGDMIHPGNRLEQGMFVTLDQPERRWFLGREVCVSIHDTPQRKT